MSNDNRVLSLWRRMSPMPGGPWLFSQLIASRAPYFRSIAPQVEEIRSGYAQVVMKKRRSILNHIGTVHAIAMCNLMELAMGMCAEASIPAELRWLPKGMTIRYTAKATTDVTGYAQVDPARFAPGEVVIDVWGTDQAGVRVIEGTITLHVSAKPAR